MLWKLLCYHFAIHNKNGTEMHTQLTFYLRQLEAWSCSSWVRTWDSQLLRNTEKISKTERMPTEVAMSQLQGQDCQTPEKLPCMQQYYCYSACYVVSLSLILAVSSLNTGNSRKAWFCWTVEWRALRSEKKRGQACSGHMKSQRYGKWGNKTLNFLRRKKED